MATNQTPTLAQAKEILKAQGFNLLDYKHLSYAEILKKAGLTK